MSIKLITCQNKLIADQKMIDYSGQKPSTTATEAVSRRTAVVVPVSLYSLRRTHQLQDHACRRMTDHVTLLLCIFKVTNTISNNNSVNDNDNKNNNNSHHHLSLMINFFFIPSATPTEGQKLMNTKVNVDGAVILT